MLPHFVVDINCGAPLSYGKKLSPPTASNVSLCFQKKRERNRLPEIYFKPPRLRVFPPLLPGCVHVDVKSLSDEKYDLTRRSGNRLQIKTRPAATCLLLLFSSHLRIYWSRRKDSFKLLSPSVYTKKTFFLYINITWETSTNALCTRM